jgi:N-acetylglucosaminyldiphosphoundecaprenol N-acetyl-beta-D-mannosaminyltransferase
MTGEQRHPWTSDPATAGTIVGTPLETLMSHGVDVHATLGSPAIDPRDEARSSGERLAALMRAGPAPRIQRREEATGSSEGELRDLSPIHSPILWSAAQRFAAIVATALLLPLVPLVWLAVKITSPGPFFFRQTRRGQGGRPFTIYKVRTLCVGAEQKTALGVTKQDPQITRIGRLLRQLKIDELPQLWNVVRGEMEVVGPRPIPTALEDRLRTQVRGFVERNRVKPGLTSLAQVAVVDNRVGADLVEDWHERFEAELHYIRRKSFGYDLVVLLMSFVFLMRSFVRVVRGSPRPEPRAGAATVTEVLGIPIADLAMDEVVDRIDAWIEGGKPRYVAFCPVHSVVEGARGPSHKEALRGAGLCVADGMPIVWAQKLLGHRNASRVYGPTTMLHALARAEQRGWRVVLYGGRTDRLERLVENLEKRFPDLEIAAAISPPFRTLSPEEDDATTRRLAALQPDLILVGLGCPKQERWMADHSGRVPGVMLGVGAAFDFHAGAVRQAPAWLQSIGMEWFFRLLCEPRRLFRRYATTNPIFVTLLAVQLAKHWLLRRRYRVELGVDTDSTRMTTTRTQRPRPEHAMVPKPGGADLAICIASYRRPQLLKGTLASLLEVELPPGVRNVEVRVVDNDVERTAEAAVLTFAAEAAPRFVVRYAVEPERSIALARNRALEFGPARYVAFIDDDERADRWWLRGLWDAMQAGRADAAFGRVESILPPEAPGWVRRGGFHEKPAGPENLDLGWERTRTSNTLVDGVWFFEYGYRFDARFGRSGGEDTDLFRRIAAAGGRFRAAPASAVREIANAAQCTLGWILRRAWRGGGNYERLVASERGRLAPLARFLKRIAVGVPIALCAIPAALRGRPEHLFGALQGLALAGGGLVGWLRPQVLENARGYRSAGTLDERQRASTKTDPKDPVDRGGGG